MASLIPCPICTRPMDPARAVCAFCQQAGHVLPPPQDAHPPPPQAAPHHTPPIFTPREWQRVIAFGAISILLLLLAFLVVRPLNGSLPKYVVLFSNNFMSGDGRFGDILIPSFSRQTPVWTREKIFLAIAAKEELTEASFYSSEDAYRANISASFLKTHPNALREGFLGRVKDGSFSPPW